MVERAEMDWTKRHGLVRLASRVGAVAVAAVAWEAGSRYGGYDSRLVPGPASVVSALGEMAVRGELARDAGASIARAFAGFAGGSSVGLIVGLLTGRSRVLSALLEPLLQGLRSIPSIALLPLAILWLGLGEASKLFLVFWGVFFPVWVNTHLGVFGVDAQYVYAALSMGARKRDVLREVIVPGALPLIVAGMRVGVGLSFLNLVAAEMSGASVGLGYRVSASHLVFRTDRMLAAMMALGALGSAADWAFRFVLARAVPWSEHQGGTVGR